MRPLIPFLIAALSFGRLSATESNAVITCAADLAKATESTDQAGRSFDLTASVLLRPHNPVKDDSYRVTLIDKSGCMLVSFRDAVDVLEKLHPGDVARVKGIIEIGPKSHRAFPECRECILVGKGPLPEPVAASGRDVADGKADYRLVTITGFVRDVVVDEVDARFAYLILICDGESIFLPVNITNRPISYFKSLVGATLSADGIVDPDNINYRKQIGRLFCIYRDFRILTSSENPFLAPLLKDLNRVQPSRVRTLNRHRIRGSVIAVWQESNLLISVEDGRLVCVSLAHLPAPRYGENVEISGFPETDLANIHLTQAVWRPSAGTFTESPTTDTTIQELLTDPTGKHRLRSTLHGRLVRVNGIVKNVSVSNADIRQIIIEDANLFLPIETSSLPATARPPEVGSRIQVTGTCILNMEMWTPGRVFPGIHGIFIVPRTCDDFVTLSSPPWWTTVRLTIAICSLLLVLLGIIIWNTTLRKTVQRREKELEEEITARVAADIKVYERTRLAVELHDSLAQNLTGAALEIKTAGRLSHIDRQQMDEHLDLAAKTLESSRKELRNCLWDLRSQALEAPDMNEAIRQSLGSLIGEAAFAIRFNVPRERLSDNATHTLLRIIRELASNAIRHGHARTIRIAGSIENNHLLFSVRDDGCGFDPETCPNVDQGHFGLQGIRERIKEFNGEIEITSSAGTGTRAEVSIGIPQEDSAEKHS